MQPDFIANSTAYPQRASMNPTHPTEPGAGACHLRRARKQLQKEGMQLSTGVASREKNALNRARSFERKARGAVRCRAAAGELTLGTRGSALAMAQARTAASLLHSISGVTAHIQEIKTTGDAVTDRPLAESGVLLSLCFLPYFTSHLFIPFHLCFDQ